MTVSYCQALGRLKFDSSWLRALSPIPRSGASFDAKIQGLRAGASVESLNMARKLIDNLDSASDLDLSELKISKRSLAAGVGAYPAYPPSYAS